MKNIIIYSLILIPMLAISQRKPKIKGSRIVTEVNEELPAFNAIQLNDDLDIVLKKSVFAFDAVSALSFACLSE